MANRKLARRGFLGGIAAAPLAAAKPGKMKLAIGADHAGFPMKGPLLGVLRSWGHTIRVATLRGPGRFSGYREKSL